MGRGAGWRAIDRLLCARRGRLRRRRLPPPVPCDYHRNGSAPRLPPDTPMHSRLLLFAVVFAVTFAVPSARGGDSVKLPNKKDLQIFLLIGQSNMAGRGKPLEEQDETPHPRVLLFNKEQAWIPAVDPLHFDKPSVVGVGLGLTFAKTVAETHEKTIGLVPAAVGGSAISEWAKGARHYTGAIGRAKAALEDGTLAGILWHQGNPTPVRQKPLSTRRDSTSWSTTYGPISNPPTFLSSSALCPTTPKGPAFHRSMTRCGRLPIEPRTPALH